MKEKSYYTYIMASRLGGTLYIGVTGDLLSRVASHRAGEYEGFTKRYGVTRLVHFERFDDVNEAIKREKRLKKWNRAWKISLIERDNPNWTDLWPRLTRGSF